MTTEIFNDGILEASIDQNKWVICRWLDNEHGRLQKRLIKNLNRVEQAILAMGLEGWYTSSEVDHKDFHKLLEKFGCTPKGILGSFKYFVKPIHSESDLHKKAVV
jgi:hypothetical protein